MPSTFHRALSLNHRDALRREYDVALREVFVKLSRYFDRLPSRLWIEVRRDPAAASRPWGPFLVLIDDAIRAGATDDELLEVPAIVSAYIQTRCQMKERTPASGVMAIPEPLKRAA